MNMSGYGIHSLVSGKMLPMDWENRKAPAKRRAAHIYRTSVHEVKVVIVVDEDNGEVVAGWSNLHQPTKGRTQ